MKETAGKVCPRCGGAPHVTAAKIARGAYTCLACQRAEQKAYREAHRAERIASGKAWRAAHPDLVRAAKMRRLAKEKAARAAGEPLYVQDPAKKAARWAVKNAIRRGRMQPQPCARCGSPDSQAHHDDYSKPLDVLWFCPLHHSELHRAMKNPAAETPDVR